MKRFTVFLILAFAASLLPAASPQAAQPLGRTAQLSIQLSVPGITGLAGLLAEILWQVLVGPPVSIDPVGGTTVNDGGGWVPNPPILPPPPHP